MFFTVMPYNISYLEGAVRNGLNISWCTLFCPWHWWALLPFFLLLQDHWPSTHVYSFDYKFIDDFRKTFFPTSHCYDVLSSHCDFPYNIWTSTTQVIDICSISHTDFKAQCINQYYSHISFQKKSDLFCARSFFSNTGTAAGAFRPVGLATTGPLLTLLVYFCKKCHAPDDNKDALFQKIPAPAHLKDSKQVAFAFRPFCSYHGLHTVLLSISSQLYDELWC